MQITNILSYTQKKKNSKQSRIESERSADARQIVPLKARLRFARARFGYVVGADLQNRGKFDVLQTHFWLQSYFMTEHTKCKSRKKCKHATPSFPSRRPCR
jgi:hypothetical protein